MCLLDGQSGQKFSLIPNPMSIDDLFVAEFDD
jgi:hypothetical protein